MSENPKVTEMTSADHVYTAQVIFEEMAKYPYGESPLEANQANRIMLHLRFAEVLQGAEDVDRRICPHGSTGMCVSCLHEAVRNGVSDGMPRT